MIGLLTLYWQSLGRLKTSSWGKNSVFMILGIMIAVGALTLALILFESYENTLSLAFKASQADVSIVGISEEITGQDEKRLNNIFADFDDDIETYDLKYILSVIVNKDMENKPVFVESFNQDNESYNTSMYSFADQDGFNLRENEIVLGEYIAKDLHVKVGDKVKVIIPSTIKYSIFGLTKKTSEFIVKDIYKTGLYEIDSQRVIINKNYIKKIKEANPQIVYQIILKNRESDNSQLFTQKINNALMRNNFTFYAIDLFSQSAMLFSALTLQKMVIFLILCIIVIVAGFNVISTVSSILTEKIHEIGILMTLGLKRKEIKILYFCFSLLLAHIGIVLGLISGYGLSYVITNQDYISLKGDIYFIDKININTSWTMFLVTYATSVIIISLTILISLKKINKLNIIKIMRQ